MKKEWVKTYLMDCMGYGEDDLEGLTMNELKDLVDDWENYKNY